MTMSIRVVILTFTSSPATATIRAPGTCRSTRLQSSVADRSPARVADAYARASTPSRKVCGVWPRRYRLRSGISTTWSSSTMTSVSALGITVSVPSARPDRIGSIERWMTSRGTRGRTASWTTTTSSSAPSSAARPLRVLSLRVAPPATTITGTSSDAASTSSRVSSIQPGWETTTTRSTDEAPSARRVRSRIGSPASRTNCFGISPPNRLPSPPARTIAWICTRRDYVRAPAGTGRRHPGQPGTRGYHRFPAWSSIRRSAGLPPASPTSS